MMMARGLQLMSILTQIWELRRIRMSLRKWLKTIWWCFAVGKFRCSFWLLSWWGQASVYKLRFYYVQILGEILTCGFGFNLRIIQRWFASVMWHLFFLYIMWAFIMKFDLLGSCWNFFKVLILALSSFVNLILIMNLNFLQSFLIWSNFAFLNLVRQLLFKCLLFICFLQILLYGILGLILFMHIFTKMAIFSRKLKIYLLHEVVIVAQIFSFFVIIVYFLLQTLYFYFLIFKLHTRLVVLLWHVVDFIHFDF